MMLGKSIRIILLATCLLFQTYRGIGQDIQTVLDFYIEKSGGMFNWDSINKVVSTYTFKGADGLATLEQMTEYPWYYTVSIKNGSNTYKKVFNNTEFYEETNNVKKIIEDTTFEIVKEKHRFFPLIFYKEFKESLSYLGIQYDQDLRKNVYKIKRQFSDRTYVVYYIDIKSGYLLQMISSEGGYQKYQNFKSFQGFICPTKIVDITNSSSVELTMHSIIFEKGDKKPLTEYLTSISISSELNSDSTKNTASSSILTKKLALVIGNSGYLHGGTLKNPLNDAREISNNLKKLGFDVIKIENATLVQMKKVINDFGDKLRDYDVGLFYYAGHGIQSKGSNFMIPIEADIKNEQQVEFDCIEVDRILGFMDYAQSKVNIVILDACRNNPFERSWKRSVDGSGLAFMNAPSGTIVAYSTSPGKTADDGVGKNGLYTESLLKYMNEPSLTIEQMFKKVRADVEAKTNKLQTPWESTSLKGEFYFNPYPTNER